MKVIQDSPADGLANMQRDLDLLEILEEHLILRIYYWIDDWASYGYFQTEAQAQAYFFNEDLQFVQRPTGGGFVDHRHDLTYTLLIPKSHYLAKLSRTECYYKVHRVVQVALASHNIESILLGKEQGSSPACFTHPVPGDVVDPSGKKIAGAAQRRTRLGLLHQGSIIAPKLTASALINAFESAFSKSDQQ